jgi:nucleoid-associated protein YgaU
LSWGGIPLEGQDIPFKGFVTNLVQNFLLFDRQGKPVRARLDVTFSEFIDRETDEKQTDPELTTHVVKRGDTLQGIAARVYRDPTRWRAIAAANRLDDPRHLEVGRSLSIPELS